MIQIDREKDNRIRKKTMSESSNWFDALFRRNDTGDRPRSRSNCISNTPTSTENNLSRFRQFFNLTGLLSSTNTGESVASLG